jgi:aspartyl-tRNA(Asn)/glutamyl-tRNA(Gln) amidotransferase subunit C
MSITPEIVRKIARLARLKVTEDDVAYYGPQINGILKWVEQLQDVNTDNIEPLASVSQIDLHLREDVVTDGDKTDDILRNAPEKMEGFFVVPKIVE